MAIPTDSSIDLSDQWRQHFPTYHFSQRDIALEEYRTATKSLESEERIFLNAANIGVLAFAGIGSLFVGSLDRLEEQFSPVLPAAAPGIVLTLLTAIMSWVTLRYFADRQRAIVFAARKVIVLRRMLGISYGTVQLVLPNWRVEGADEPFAIRLFPGWTTYVGYPFFALATISSAVVFFLILTFFVALSHPSSFQSTWPIAAAMTVLWAMTLGYVYRTNLLDIHERPLLLVAVNLARFLRVHLASNVEHVLYRANLASYEHRRLKIDLVNATGLLVFIEDRSFYEHRGVSIRGSARAMLSILGLKRRSGGSTITQQLCRTLLIKDLRKLYRRKFLEIILALWLDRIISKANQLEMYLAAVRFERGVFGVVAAMRHYWGEIKSRPTKAESFFLIERVSNIRSGLMGARVAQIVKDAFQEGFLEAKDVDELIKLYREATNSGKVVDNSGQFNTLTQRLQ